jgi:polyisoprenyl-teichoic acid--peptidoglycan teichoic acid transferase
MGGDEADGRSEARRYQVTPAAPPRAIRRLRRVLAFAGAGLLMVGAALAGGAYLYVHQAVEQVQPHDPAIRAAVTALAPPLPERPAIALVLGSDRRRYGADRTQKPRSDTVMLVRADPRTHKITTLSFPRDLIVPIVCPGHARFYERLNYAFTTCGPRGTVDTIKALTGISINYLVVVDFRAFKDVVGWLGGVWIDVDHRYLNDNAGRYAGATYATIDLQPGYQRLTPDQALAYVRFRHTDSDLFRIARQQRFIASLRAAVVSRFSVFQLPKLVSVVTRNVQIAQGGHDVSAKELWRWASFVKQVPSSRVRQLRIDTGSCTFTGYFTLVTQTGCVSAAVRQFLGKRKVRASLDAGTDTWASEGARAAIGDTSATGSQLVTVPGAGDSLVHDPGVAAPLLTSIRRRAHFPLLVPTVLPQGTSPGEDTPVRLYEVTKGEQAVRFSFRLSTGEYWGVEETPWRDAPILGGPHTTRTGHGRHFALYEANGHLELVVLNTKRATYWVVNTVRNTLSDKTMMSIARGLQPLATAD